MSSCLLPEGCCCLPLHYLHYFDMVDRQIRCLKRCKVGEQIAQDGVAGGRKSDLRMKEGVEDGTGGILAKITERRHAASRRDSARAARVPGVVRGQTGFHAEARRQRP